ncbi:MAG: hypothetical protein HYV06_08235 [Deltaproteobacteria bacterium]|nr:hypothetical protein [Deltaproteobacteria bacterium]
MKHMLLAVLAAMLLSACGVAHVIPGDGGKPKSITESGYTSGGCIESLHEKATELGVSINITPATKQINYAA